MKFTGERPVYLQIVDDVTLQITSGELPPGGRLAPVRDLAMRLGVNPNTVQRAFAELERRGLVGAQGTVGRFVTDDGTARLALRTAQAEEAAAQYAATMKRLGYTAEEAAEAVRTAFDRPCDDIDAHDADDDEPVGANCVRPQEEEPPDNGRTQFAPTQDTQSPTEEDEECES